MDLMDCPRCGNLMTYIHQHDTCYECGVTIGCCEGAPQSDSKPSEGVSGTQTPE